MYGIGDRQAGLNLRLPPGCESALDLRILVAGMTLVRVHDIVGPNC